MTPPKSERQTVVRALFVGALCGAVASILPFIAGTSKWPIMFVFALSLNVPATLVLGVLTYYFLKRVHALNWPMVAVVGTSLGVLVAAVLTTNSPGGYLSYLYFGAVGLVTALCSLFAFRRSNLSLNADVPRAWADAQRSGPPVS